VVTRVTPPEDESDSQDSSRHLPEKTEENQRTADGGDPAGAPGPDAPPAYGTARPTNTAPPERSRPLDPKDTGAQRATLAPRGAERLYYRFIALALGLNALLGLGLIAFDVADSVVTTRKHLEGTAETVVAIFNRLRERDPHEPSATIMEETARLTETPMALLDETGSVLHATDRSIRKYLAGIYDGRPRPGIRMKVTDALGDLSGAWVIAPIGGDLNLLVVVPHSPEDEGLLQYMTIGAGVLGLGLAISFWVMLASARWMLHRPLQRIVAQLTGALARDIDRRRAAESQAIAAREEAERHLAFRDRLIDTSEAVGIVATDAQGQIRIFNRAAERILGFTTEEALENMSLDQLRHEVQRVPSSEAPLRSLMKPMSGEQFLIDKHGNQHLVAVSEGDIVDGDTQTIGKLITFSDMTERRRLEAELHLHELQLIQSAKMASVGEMATGIAHELNQPLNNIGLLATRILRRIKGETEIDRTFCAEKLEAVQGQVHRASRIIDQLRSFGRRSEGTLEDVDVHRPVKHVTEMLSAQLSHYGIELRVELPGQLPKVRADSAQLEQVLLNLLVNACDAHCEGLCDATPRGSDPWVHITADETAFADGREALDLLVTDNGPGMDQELQTRIFQPFFTTKEVGKGTGLGLSISYSLVRGFGGTLSVDSTSGQGTRFTVRLPLATLSEMTPDDGQGTNPAD